MNSFDIISDLHLEHRNADQYPKLTPTAPILILAGDIGWPEHLRAFFSSICSLYDYIIYVPGNHEYYDKNSHKTEIDTKIVGIVNEYENIVFLNNECIELCGMRFVGSTLWSHPATSIGLNDFKHIQIKNSYGIKHPIDLDIFWEWNKQALDYLRNNVHENDVVITHFMPQTHEALAASGFKSKYPKNDTATHYYGNEGLNDVFAKAALWVSGHTHESFDVEFHSTRWVCEPLGYPQENEKKNVNNATQPKCVNL